MKPIAPDAHSAPAAPAAAEPGHDDHLQHHFESAEQQYDSSKLGMWLFLATEVLMFGGLFCAYSIYRGNHPEIFAWASNLLDTKLGAINTVVLLTSSFTMATAVRCAQLSQYRRLVFFLGLTLLGAFGFLGIKYMEYKPKFEHGLLWGTLYRPDPEYVAHHFGIHPEEGHGAAEEAKERPADLARGRGIAKETCASCHGVNLLGLPNNGVDLIHSEFVQGKTDDELLAFLKTGRQSFDPASRTGIQMPPRGGNPTLDDDKLRDVIAYMRTVQAPPGEAGAEVAVADAEEPAGSPGGEDEAPLPRSVLPPAPAGPGGLAHVQAASVVPASPENVHHFFGIYFAMTGLHGLHVVGGVIVIGWLLFGGLRRRYHAGYYTPVDMVGLYWHVVDVIWIFLFPLFYLI